MEVPVSSVVAAGGTLERGFVLHGGGQKAMGESMLHMKLEWVEPPTEKVLERMTSWRERGSGTRTDLTDTPPLEGTASGGVVIPLV